MSVEQEVVIKPEEVFGAVPSVSRGLHDELQIISALPPAAGVCEVHLLSILSHRQVVDERQFPAGDHLTP